MDCKYKIGQKVRIRKDLTAGAEYPMQSGDRCGWDPGVAEDMEKYRGQIMTICYTKGYYTFFEDDRQWSWSDTMFESPKQLTCKSLL